MATNRERPSNLPEATEQPRGRLAPSRQTLLQHAANNWEKADAEAIKACMAGTADGIQQRRAMDWILRSACALPEFPYVPGDIEATHLHLGRQFVAHQIMKLAQLNLSTIKGREPNADAHEPK